MAFLCPVRIRRGKKKKFDSALPSKQVYKKQQLNAANIALSTLSFDVQQKKLFVVSMTIIDVCEPAINNTKHQRLLHLLIKSLSLAIGSDGDKDLSRPNSGLAPGMGRITGSASIETLVRVGIEKEHGLSPDSKMVVLHDFTPCVDDELEVKRGQIVNILYRENDWVYVIGLDNRQEGFIPHSYCTPYNSQLAELAVKKKLPRDQSTGRPGDLNDGEIAGADTSDCDSLGKKQGLPGTLASSPVSLHSEPDMLPFCKDPSGRYIVLYTFIARDENDVSVERGEFVTVLNREDPDWYWIVRSDGQEGFIPSGFVYPADNVIQGHLNASVTQQSSLPQQSNSHHFTSPNNEDLRYHGTELVMLYDYKAQAPDDLSVRRGDWIYADLTNQTVDGWLWAYAPKTRKYGFIPKAYARPPAMTSL